MTKSSGVDTFGELSEKDFKIFSALLFSNNCLQVHMIFEQCWVNSIKGGEFQQRKASIGLKSANQSYCQSSSKAMPKVKKKAWLEWYNSACFISTIDFLEAWTGRNCGFTPKWTINAVLFQCMIPMPWVIRYAALSLDSTQSQAVTGPVPWQVEGRKRHGTFFVVVSAIKIVCLSSWGNNTWV